MNSWRWAPQRDFSRQSRGKDVSVFEDWNRWVLLLVAHRTGKSTIAHIDRIFPYGAVDRFTNLRVLLHERRRRLVVDSQHVVADQDLTVAMRSGTNADRWNGQSLGHFSGHIIGHS